MKKQVFYAVLAVIGACLSVLALVLRNFSVPDSIGGMLMGMGSGLCAMGLAQMLTLRIDQRHPEQARQSEIAAKDERNIAIRRRAKALSGDMLQWAVMVGAWLSIGLGAPLWIVLLAITVFVLKSVIDVCLIVHYQKLM